MELGEIKMSLYVSTNVSSLNATRQLFTSNSNLSTHLSVVIGLSINGERWPPAGLQISNRLTSQVMGVEHAVRNANCGISLSQNCRGSHGENSVPLQSVFEVLSVQRKRD